MRKLFTIIFLLFVLFPAFAQKKATAHPIPLIIQEINANISECELELDYTISIDPIALDDAYPIIDINNDKIITIQEFSNYATNIVLKNLVVKLNNSEIRPAIESLRPLAKREITDTNDLMEIKFRANIYNLQLENELFINYNYNFIPADEFGDQIDIKDNIERIETFKRMPIKRILNLNDGDYYTDFEYKNFNQTQGKPECSDKAPITESTKKTTSREGFVTRISNAAKEYSFKKNGFGFFLIGLLIAIIAGAVHAITPGHGKSLMASFLIAKKKSNFSDVVVLGATITLTHTIAIYVIGLVLYLLQAQNKANLVELWLKRASALLLILFALNLIYKSYKSYRHSQYHKHLNEEHSHHDHNHSHNHSHGPKDMKIRSKWDLIYAGFSGGITPCLDALSILFVAFNLGKIGFGLILIFFFSLGLASTIILIGAAVISGSKRMNLEEKFGPKVEIYAPLFSAILIIGISLLYFFRF